MPKIIYLYLKTHNKTGLNYLGKTINNPYKYQGSGKYWKYHINKHGADITTTILLETTSEEEIREAGLYYSNLWNIVESKQFANLMEESGQGNAPGFFMSDEWRANIGKSSIGHKRNKPGALLGKNNPMYGVRRLGVDSPRRKKVKINNEVFNTCKDASEYYNVSRSTITYWIKIGKAQEIQI
jgi:hypothetical protein